MNIFDLRFYQHWCINLFMLPGKSSLYIITIKAFTAVLLATTLTACFTIVKKYPVQKPFVYKTNINLIGKFSNAEKEGLLNGLRGQLDDSIRVRKLDKLLWSVLRRPPVYDSINADNSIVYMRALLHASGYFNDSIYYRATIDTSGEQYRTAVDFYVTPGKVYRLDSISYSMRTPDLQHIADSTRSSSFIKKGEPFARAPVSAELDRLTELYRNSGYLRFGREELVGLWDTLDVSLLQPTLDPFEQLELLQKLRARRENPTANLEIRLKTIDSAKLVKYYIGNVTLYPNSTSDTLGLERRVKVVDGITVIQHYNQFKPKIFPDNVYLDHDSLYRIRRYLRTINRLNSLGTWRSVNIEQYPRKNQDTVDFVIRLTPAKKYSFNTNVESSINQSAISGNLFGVGLNVGLQNRNFAKGANIANSNVRFGIELGSNKEKGLNQFIQTRQLAFSHSIYSPRVVPNFKFIPKRFKDNFRSVFNFNAATTERRLLYNLTTVNASYGYEFQFPRRKILASIKPVNVEFSNLIKRDSLNKLIALNPSLANIFTDGFVSSIIGNFTVSGGSSVNRINRFRANIEQSGVLLGMFRNTFLDDELYRYIKTDAEFARLIRFPKSTSLALRFFAGIGYEYDFTRDENKRNNLPFFKQYFAGGPNSMRAWSLRRLGPGSTIKEFNGPGATPDRYGDVQLEGNVEYRFPLGKLFSTIQINGAVFTDVGNVWFMKNAPNRPAEEVFKFGRLGKDLAVGAGAGLRADLNFFVIRFEYAYKVKDPSPAPAYAAIQNKWFGYRFFDGDQFQLGIGYPFNIF